MLSSSPHPSPRYPEQTIWTEPDFEELLRLIDPDSTSSLIKTYVNVVSTDQVLGAMLQELDRPEVVLGPKGTTEGGDVLLFELNKPPLPLPERKWQEDYYAVISKGTTSPVLNNTDLVSINHLKLVYLLCRAL